MADRVVFGPLSGVDNVDLTQGGWALATAEAAATATHVCLCVGPRHGEKFCPCALRAESAKGKAMIRDGVTIDGVEYDLVRRGP